MLLLNIILGAVIAIYTLAGIAALFPPKPFPRETKPLPRERGRS